MESKNQVGDMEDMFVYRFIGINAMTEEVEIFNIIAGCEDDAFDIVEEDETKDFYLLSDKMVKKLYDEIQKVDDIL